VLVKTDFVRKKYGPLLDRSLPQALAHFLGREFPRLGGDRFLALAAQLILDFLADHLRAPEALGPGQILWLAVSRDDPPAYGKRITHTDLVPVALALHAPEDVEAILERQSRSQLILQKCLRLCEQAYRQGGLLGNCDLSALLKVDERTIATLLTDHERRTETLVPRRATLHDVGTGLTHKRLICWKRFAEGKAPEQVARETYHSLEAVDRYLAQFDRVRHCRQQNLPPEQIAYILRCTRSLVDQYLAIDQELEKNRAS
jgi:DNA-binding CsgD family transcriptional regulator